MPRSRSRNRRTVRRRDPIVVANPYPSSFQVVRPTRRYRPRPAYKPIRIPLLQIEDRRLWHPDPTRPAKTTSGLPRYRLIDRQDVKTSRRARISFASPHKMVICIRRKIREEVLHALKKTGRGVSRRKPRRNNYSNVEC